jgi:excisionase family DNA binding protein
VNKKQNTKIEDGERLLTDKDVAQIFGITSRAVWGWRQKGLLPYLRVGRTIRFRRQSIDRLLAELEMGGK